MSPIFSTIITTSLLILFFSFLSTRIDQSTKWNWFIVFIPLYLLQAFFMIDTIFLLIKNSFSFNTKFLKLFSFLICIILTFIFEILICLKLEYYSHLRLAYILTPAWIVMTFQIVYLLSKLSK